MSSTSRASTSNGSRTMAKTQKEVSHPLRVSIISNFLRYGAKIKRALLEEEVETHKAHENAAKPDVTPQKPKVSKEDESLSPFSDEDDVKQGKKKN